ncbi:MAG TPA: hypothetical protein DCE42_27460 [Myxococcales bacterium]|nr:hypothetical protein [Deltaproteobacteria bacterium]HAA58531.1 hypothetical protein [Myxococcales bacterium]
MFCVFGARTKRTIPSRGQRAFPVRSRLCLLALVVCLALSSACGTFGVGEACQSDQECLRGLYCDLGAPDGYCSMECDETLPCPRFSYCATVETQDPSGAPINIRRCLKPCGSNDDCRAQYTCTQLPLDQIRVCFPTYSI